MTATLEALLRDALVLSPDQRVELAYRLLLSIEPQAEAETDSTWAAESASRIARFDRGESRSVPAAEVFASLRGVASGQ